MVIAVLLAGPNAAGLLLLTLIYNHLPCGVEDGIRHAIVPGEVPANVPIETGVVKLPDASLNSAVKILLPTTLLESVNERLSEAPAQIEEGTVPTTG
jgi:hypothetical protein